MKWVSVNNGISGDHYELWDNDARLVSLSLSKRTKTARIESASDKRLFFIEKKGFLHSKTVIKNEYGIKLGELNNGELWHEGVIDLDGKRYCYAFPHDAQDQLIIYNEFKTAPLVSCSLSAVFDNVPAVMEKASKLHDTRYPSLLMALCWYLLRSTVQQTVQESAA